MQRKGIFIPFHRALPKCQALCWAPRNRLTQDSQARTRMREREGKHSVSRGSEEPGEGSWKEATLRIDRGEHRAVGDAAWYPGAPRGGTEEGVA